MQNGATIASKNEARGFYGTIEQHAEPNQAWALAIAGITKSTGAAIRPSTTSSIAGTAGTSPMRSRWASAAGETSGARSIRRSSAGWTCKRRCSKEPPKRAAQSIAPRRARVPDLRPACPARGALPPRWPQADRGVEALMARVAP